MFIGNDTLLFAVFCQLKSYPDLYAGYVPMAYIDYLKNMSKYVHISHYAMLFLIMWCYCSPLCSLIAFCVDVPGVANGVIMSRCRLLQIGYEEINSFHSIFSLYIILFLFYWLCCLVPLQM